MQKSKNSNDEVKDKKPYPRRKYNSKNKVYLSIEEKIKKAEGIAYAKGYADGFMDGEYKALSRTHTS